MSGLNGVSLFQALRPAREALGFGARPPTNGRYDAFISYSWTYKPEVAKALQEALERLAKPWYRTRVLRICRDDTELPPNSDLEQAIFAKLDVSEFLILLASPDAASKPWVDREVSHWLESHPRDRLLVVLIEGTIRWGRDVDTPPFARDVLPPVLRADTDLPFLYVDLSWPTRLEDLDLSSPRFRQAVIKLAAPLHGYDTPAGLDSEAKRQSQRTARAVRAGLAAVTLAGVVAIIFGVLAWIERGNALRESHVALSRELAAEAGQVRTSQPNVALLLGATALRIADTTEARSSVLATLLNRVGAGGLHHTSQPIGTSLAAPSPNDAFYDDLPDLTFSPDTTEIADETAGGLAVWSVASGRLKGFQPNLDKPGNAGLAPTISADDRKVAFVASGYATAALGVPPLSNILGHTQTSVGLWDLRSRRIYRARVPVPRNDPTELAFDSHDANHLVIGTASGMLYFWDLGSKREWRPPISLVKARAAPSNGEGSSAVTGLVDNGLRTVAATADGRLFVIATNSREGAKPQSPVISGADSKELSISPDGEMAATINSRQQIVLWNLQASKVVAIRPLVGRIATTGPNPFAAPLALGDGLLLATTSLGDVIYETPGLTEVAVVQTRGDGPGMSFSLDPSRPALALTNDSGGALVLMLDARSLLQRACAVAGRELTRQEWDAFVGSTVPYVSACGGLTH